MMFNNLKKLVSPKLKLFIKHKLKIDTMGYPTSTMKRLKRTPRYTKTSALIDGFNIIIPDGASFIFMYNEIFKTEIYKFKTKNKTPYIIDGGANIGLATIYFKKIHPNAEIVAFEPDPEIFDILQTNINTYAFDKVKLIQKGLWNEELILKFQSEGADAGLLDIFDESDLGNSQSVPVTSLKPYLHKPVDFLKLDIEGAETVVLKDIEEDLVNVAKIFVEYHSFIGQPQSLHEIIDILTRAKFRLYMSIPGDNSIKRPFMGLSNYNNMDFQLNIFGFRQD